MATKVRAADARASSLAGLSTLTRLPGVSVMTIDGDGCVTALNGVFERAAGPSHRVVGQLFATVFVDLAAVDDALRRALDGHASVRTADLAGQLVELRTAPLAASDGRRGGAIAMATDAKALASAERRLRAIERVDELTSLPGASALESALELAVSDASHGNATALVRLRVGAADLVSTGFGPVERDALLRAVAGRLRATLDVDLFVAFLGGCDFAVIVRGLAGDGRASGADVARRLGATAGEPLLVGRDQLELSPDIAVGFAVAPYHGAAPPRLLELAEARVLGRDPAAGHAERELQIRSRIGGAAARGELELAYQPIFDLHTATPSGVEALLRWHEPSLGTLLPGAFLPIAKQTGAIHSLGAWALDELVAHAAVWRAADLRPLDLHFNLSGAELAAPRAAVEILGSLRRAGISPGRLVIEMSESELIAHPGAEHALPELRAAGVSFALDDFGAAPCSLTRLTRSRVDVIKLDRALVGAVEGSAEAQAIVKSLCTLAASLQIRLIAVGIETAGQDRLLQELGCRYGQGFALARPARRSAR